MKLLATLSCGILVGEKASCSAREALLWLMWPLTLVAGVYWLTPVAGSHFKAHRLNLEYKSL